MDFLAVGDTVVDEFITLKEAEVDHERSTISMRWGEKIPYESSTLVAGVGNAANAAVSAARLGLSSGFLSNVGDDHFGTQILDIFKSEGVTTDYIAVHDGIPTNHHYVLSYDSERTILIRHEAYPYRIPEGLVPPAWVYLSSVAAGAEAFHDELAEWLEKHPETKLVFQPGTFQIAAGKERLAKLYARAEVVAVNKGEAERILGVADVAMQDLLRQMHSLGPRMVLITDGPRGAYVYDGTDMLTVPMYPDPKPPVNRTGAGDATTSTFVVALALGKPLAEALAWGPVNAMSVVGHVGAQKGLLTRVALEKFLTEAPPEYRVTPL